jgi:peptidoglycan hydrolase CwlO-like protein
MVCRRLKTIVDETNLFWQRVMSEQRMRDFRVEYSLARKTVMTYLMDHKLEEVTDRKKCFTKEIASHNVMISRRERKMSFLRAELKRLHEEIESEKAEIEACKEEIQEIVTYQRSQGIQKKRARTTKKK